MRGRSLRTRLTVILMAFAAVGMILLAAITYGSQKNFLAQQTNEQVQAALRVVPQAVFMRQRYADAVGSGADTTTGAPPAAPGDSPGDESGASSGVKRPTGGPGGPPAGGRGDLPPSTYGEVRSTDGTLLLTPYVQAGNTTLPKPKLPKDIPIGKTFTVPAVSGDGTYRVKAQRTQALTAAGLPVETITVAAVPLNHQFDQLRELLLVDAIVIGSILLVLGFVASRLVRGELMPLQHIAQDADAIAAGELDRRVPEAAPGTEVGRLGLALNAMLGRIEVAFAERKASEDRLRVFLSDASHELRTPLASIRGYAELQRTGMLTDEAERMKAVTRIEEQAARMGTLVEDLLALARLDEERAPKTELVEIAVISRDAVADARPLDTERAIKLDVDGDPLVLGEEAKLRQVLTNLLGNAVAHTPPGSPIAVHVRAEGTWAVIDVDDAGEGVPPEQRAQIFERFHRSGGTSRTRGPAGAGLGLAVVAGIVDSHGGTVTVSDAPTGGARFTVRLPIVDTADEDS